MTTLDYETPVFEDGDASFDPAPASSSLTFPARAIQAIDSIRNSFAQTPHLNTENQIHTQVTRSYLDLLDPTKPLAPHVLERGLLALLNAVIKDENQKMPKGDLRYPPLRTLTPWQVAQVLLRLHHVIRIAPSKGSYDRDYDLLGMYNEDGPNKGVYTTSEDDIRTIARRYNNQMSLANFKELAAVLKEDAPRLHVNHHRDVIAVNNGIFFYGNRDRTITVDGIPVLFRAKTLHDFTPSLVFTAKSHVDYVHNAPKQVITHPKDKTVWDIESWISELSDDEGVPELLWEIIGAIIRPHVRWGKTAWFFSEVGNNGKGTLCELMRNMIGHDAHTSIALADLGRDFALEPLIKVNAVIVDENDVGTFIDKAANLKTIVTNDVIHINRKHKVPIAFQFFGLMVQCLNEFPRAKDKSESFYRRQLFVPFQKSYTGIERKYIKEDYLQRREVLEYALWYVLHQAGTNDPGNYYEFAEPLATRIVLDEYKQANDPVRAFWEEFRERFTWGLLPFPFLYDLYKAWFADVSPSGSPVSRQQFVSDLAQIVRKDPDWSCEDKSRKIRPAQLMKDPEILIAQYELKAWLNNAYKGDDIMRRSTLTNLQPNYRGLLRRPSGNGATAALTPLASTPEIDGDNHAAGPDNNQQN